jgi:chemotaxis protein methyltransferase WspC
MTLTRLVLQEWNPRRPEEPLRLLSLPCSTGEEPYSMAMALFDAGLPPERFRVVAIDISRRSLKRARLAIYGKNSFRGEDLGFRDRYFELEFPGWRLAEKVRRQVHFEQGNLMDANLLLGPHVYDAVFCRNVLIYFDREAQQRVVATLDRLLAPEGVLFMGPSESSLLPADRFVPARLAHAFAFRKTGARSLPPKEKTEKKPRRSRMTSRPLPAAASVLRPASKPASAPPKPAPAPPAAVTLEEIERLADAGNLAEAATRCEAWLGEQGPSARAYRLMGLIKDAGRQTQAAVEFYRKALYLDPQNEEALGHLASLLQGQGDKDAARLLLNRARRLTEQRRA